jgi:hypothetical protein
MDIASSPQQNSSSPGTRCFCAVLEKGDRALGWTVVRVPFEPHEVWPKMVRQRVCGTVRGPLGEVAFRTSLFPEPGGGGRYVILVNRAMQRGSGVVPGAEAEISLEPDLQERPADLPEELDALLDEAEGLRAWYGELTGYTRREIGKWIRGVKGEEARLRRAEQMAERLLSTMEAEVELPPLLERAFRLRPKAHAGWQRMTAAQRRGELMAVFYYQTPEAREKRVGKLVEAAEKRAEKA